MGKQVEVSVPQRCEAVLKLLRKEEPAAQIARRLGVSEPTLYRWRDEFVAGGQAALGSGKGAGDRRDRQIKELRQELDQRDQVIGELTIANRILKKTSAGLL